MTERVSIHRTAWNSMVRHVCAAYPREGCGGMWGLKAGGEVRILHVSALPNRVAEHHAHKYEVDPEHLLQADQMARELGYRLAGIFHSHPDAQAHFSETDLRNCCPWYLYLVLSVRRGEVAEVRCWKPAADASSVSEVSFSLFD